MLKKKLLICCVVFVLFVYGAMIRIDGSERQDIEQATQFVHSALLGELEGNNTIRNKLLDDARSLEPDLDVARWHSGFIRHGSKWYSLEEIEQRASSDRRLQQYDTRRSQTDDNSASHAKLANWCARNRLLPQARFHLAKALQERKAAQFVERATIDKLGFMKANHGVESILVSKSELDRHAKKAEQYQQAWRKWMPRLKKIGKSLKSSRTKTRERALRDLRAIDDPHAIPVLESVAATLNRALAMEILKVIGNIPQHEATMSLTRHAVLASDNQIRDAAANELTNRPWHDFVPFLLEQLSSPLRSTYYVQSLPNGHVFYSHNFFREGANENYAVGANTLLDTALGPREIRVRMRKRTVEMSPATERLHPALVQFLLQRKVAEREERVLQENQQSRWMNQRVGSVLSEITGEADQGDSVQWWRWWQEYNELHVDDAKPLVAYFNDYTYKFGNPYRQVSYIPSCFPAGTKVWTQRGRANIEQIQSGDMVLAQSPDTGELKYQVVLGTTIRPATKMLRMRIQGQDIRLTRGHPVWVNGKGWKMAKFVEPGNVVHGVQGALTVEAMEEVPAAVAYNLIVSQFHSYFVGDLGVLVHDNTLRQPTLAAVPGLTQHTALDAEN